MFTCGACQLTLVGDAKFTYVDGPSRIEGTYTRTRATLFSSGPRGSKVGVLRSLDFERWTFDEPLVDEGIGEQILAFLLLHATPDQPAVVLDLELEHCSACRR